MDQKITFVVPQGMDVTITVTEGRLRNALRHPDGSVVYGSPFPAGYFSEDPEWAEAAEKLYAEDPKLAPST